MILHMKFMKGFHKHPKITIAATTFINMNRWKWILLPCLLVNIQAAIYINILLARCRAFEHAEPTTIYITNLRFHLHFRQLALLQRILLIVTTGLLLKTLEEFWSFTVTTLTNICWPILLHSNLYSATNLCFWCCSNFFRNSYF